MKDIKEITKFITKCLKNEGYSKELISYLLSSYDLEMFINNTNKNKYELATHFIGHAEHIAKNTFNY